MHTITVTQFVDDDDDVITTATTEPPALAVSVLTSGRIVDIEASSTALRKLGADGLSELFTLCAQSAFTQRYDSLVEAE